MKSFTSEQFLYLSFFLCFDIMHISRANDIELKVPYTKQHMCLMQNVSFVSIINVALSIKILLDDKVLANLSYIKAFRDLIVKRCTSSKQSSTSLSSPVC